MHHRVADPVAALADGVDDGRVAELGAQPADRRLDGGGERVGVLVPDAFEQFLGGDDPVAGGEQAFEDGELLRAQLEAPAGAGRDPAARVERQVAASRVGGSAGVERRPSARTRATSSAKSNGLGR